MLYKALAAVAIAAQLSGAAACGWEGERCCNPNPNNYNLGTCIQDRTACWEGTCMPCGKDGKPVCAGAPSQTTQSLFTNVMHERGSGLLLLHRVHALNKSPAVKNHACGHVL